MPKITLGNSKKAYAVAGILYFFMAIVIVALFMPTVITSLNSGLSNLSSNTTDYGLIKIILNFWPVWFGIFTLIIFLLILRQ